jgi:protoporphyrinogen oxidase
MTRSYPDSGIALIIGAGPAGLTAAYEIATRTSLKPIVVESTSNVGGISQTAIHNGNRIDFGGHRFFSKSRRVMDWWLDRLPLENSAQGQDVSITYQRQSTDINPAKFADPNETDRVMLVRNRL